MTVFGRVWIPSRTVNILKAWPAVVSPRGKCGKTTVALSLTNIYVDSKFATEWNLPVQSPVPRVPFRRHRDWLWRDNFAMAFFSEEPGNCLGRFQFRRKRTGERSPGKRGIVFGTGEEKRSDD